MAKLILVFLLTPFVVSGNEGKLLYEKKCFACHSVDHHRVGPLHKGVFGRKIAGLEDYDYSKSLKKMGKEGKVWSEKNLNEWLRNPSEFARGNKMGVRVNDAIERRKIINYLKFLN